eukprot:11031328-Karenia_brevis.AAC.1
MSIIGHPPESLLVHVSHWESTSVIVIPCQSLAIRVSLCHFNARESLAMRLSHWEFHVRLGQFTRAIRHST